MGILKQLASRCVLQGPNDVAIAPQEVCRFWVGFRIGIERTGEYGVHDAKQIGLVARESRIAAFADVDLWEIAAWLDTVSVVFRTLLPKCLGQERLARHMVTIGLHVREHGAAMNAPSLLTFVTVVLNKQHGMNLQPQPKYTGSGRTRQTDVRSACHWK